MTAAVVLDLVLVLAVAWHLVRGWRAGGIVSILTVAGALAGVWLGMWLLPGVLRRLTGPVSEGNLPAAVVLLAALALAAGLGEFVFGQVARHLSSRARGRTARRIDSLVGALAQGLTITMLITMLASGLRPVVPPALASALNSSRVLPVLDAVVPQEAGRVANRFAQRFGDLGFPRAFSGLTPEPVLPVAAPDPAVARLAAVRTASASVVKVMAPSGACAQGHEGSGWVVAPHRVVTNAHVVAGASRTTVQAAGTRQALAATVVAFDPELDLAILDVPALDRPALKLAPALAKGASTVVTGYPLDGSLTLRAARVRGTVTATGDDIYGRRGIARQVYSVAGDVEPGNSGGPLLTQDGRVAGTVFARSVVDPSTGYVLTNQATAAMLRTAAQHSTAVSTQACAKD